MDLPLVRFRQIVAAINRRLYMDRRKQIELVSWQTRTLSTFIAGGYMTDGHNPAIDHATTVAYDEIESEQIKESALQSQESGSVDGIKFDADGNIISEAKPMNNGSFERFMGSMGNPLQWAGR